MDCPYQWKKHLVGKKGHHPRKIIDLPYFDVSKLWIHFSLFFFRLRALIILSQGALWRCLPRAERSPAHCHRHRIRSTCLGNLAWSLQSRSNQVDSWTLLESPRLPIQNT
jgi:hypothetical protein